MKWNFTTAKRVEDLFNENKTDEQIAEILHSTPTSIQRLRSKFGITKHHKKGVYKRVSVTKRKKEPASGYVGAYIDLDGKKHFIYTNTTDLEQAKKLAEKIMLKNNVREVTLYEPVKQLAIRNSQIRELNDDRT